MAKTKRRTTRRCAYGYVKSKSTGKCVYATGFTGRKLSKKRSSKKRSHKRSGRPSPNVSAKLFKPGHKMRGHDGNMWKIAVTSNGTQRWVKL